MKYLNELVNLQLPNHEFAVFGSGPLGIRNLREINDLDIVVVPALWKDLKQRYSVTQKGSICVGNIEIFKDWLPLFPDVHELIDTADTFEGIRFVKLEHVLKWKKSLGRDKDKSDIELIKEYLHRL